jgi:hypothetical protein
MTFDFFNITRIEEHEPLKGRRTVTTIVNPCPIALFVLVMYLAVLIWIVKY